MPVLPGSWGRPTLGELYRRIEAMDTATQRSFKDIDDRLANTLVARGEYLARHEALVQRVVDLEDNNQGLATTRRNVIIAVVAAVVSSLGSWIALAVHAF